MKDVMEEQDTEIKKLVRFAEEHSNDNEDRLLLNAPSYPEVDMKRVIEHLEGRKRARSKLPSWYSHKDIFYPSKLSIEQCSSESSAIYKAGLATGSSLTDLTGGFGVDCAAFAGRMKQVDYYERDPLYCLAAENNFKALGLDNITIHHADSTLHIGEILSDTIYVDPHRRGEYDRRLYDIRDCEPDVTKLKEGLLEHCRRLMVKLSPMADISQTLHLLPECREIHIVSVKNECKEILAILEKEGGGPVRICASEIEGGGEIHSFSFLTEEEEACTAGIAEEPEAFLYEPYSSVIKSGAFKLLAQRYGTPKLGKNSHLYTGKVPDPGFPGRKFRICSCMSLSAKELRKLSKVYPQANITVRNFPLSVNEIRKISRIKEGGDVYIFATTLSDDRKIYIICKKI